MNVPNHERKAFRDMTPEERSVIVEAILTDNAEAYGAAEWQAPSPWVAFDGIYRIKPRQLVIPWEHIKPEYKWAAVDEGGDVYFYKVKPELRLENWSGGIVCTASALNIDTSGIDWRDSLVQRPEGV